MLPMLASAAGGASLPIPNLSFEDNGYATSGANTNTQAGNYAQYTSPFVVGSGSASASNSSQPQSGISAFPGVNTQGMNMQGLIMPLVLLAAIAFMFKKA